MKAKKIEDREHITRMNQYPYKHAKSFVDNYENDPDKRSRMKKQQCKHCTYYTAFAGQAFTPSNCIRCGSELWTPNTDIDVLCIYCAKELDSCKHCGGAMN